MSDADQVPDITVELEDRRPVFAESTLAGLFAGGCLLAVVAVEATPVAAVGFPHLFESPEPGVPHFFHALLTTMFGSLFGLLVDSRPFWMYGRGFLGPAVGAAFGLALWAAAAVVFWPALLTVTGLPLGIGTVPPTAVALGSYVAYGVLVGSFLNLLSLVRV